MSELSEELEEKIQDLLFEADDLYDEEDIEPHQEMLKKGLDMLPGKPEEYDLGFTMVKDICEAYFFVGKYDKVKDWIELFLECDKKQRGFGKSEILAGKLEFEIGNKNKAKEYFTIADKKSKGRVWKGEDDPKYFMFFKEK